MQLFGQVSPVSRDPPNTEWPEKELETLGACPVCGSRKRISTQRELRDSVFFCAPGAWSAWKCQDCNVQYLDPRPTESSIHKAYANYYTHGRPASSLLRKLLEKLRIGIRHSYLNKRLGYRLSGELPFGWIAYEAMPRQATITLHTIRHLPPPRPNENSLLDIGCGDGEFLSIARGIGYDVAGLEVDPLSRTLAQKAGFLVHSGPFPGAVLQQGRYDYITMSHVLEHFHDPVGAIRCAFDLLKPGGRIWIKVPNLSASSHARFDQNLFILDPPRHLVMFDRPSLEALLREAGFGDVTSLPPSFLDQQNFFVGGWATSRGYDPIVALQTQVPGSITSDIVEAFDQACSSHDQAEVVTMIATKP